MEKGVNLKMSEVNATFQGRHSVYMQTDQYVNSKTNSVYFWMLQEKEYKIEKNVPQDWS